MDAVRPTSLSLIMRLQAAADLGWTATCLDPQTGWLWRVSKGDRCRIFAGPTSALNDAAAARLAVDKFYTGAVLAAAGLAVPESVRCLRPGAFVFAPEPSEDLYASQRGLAPGLALAEDVGLPLVVKPNRGARGREVVLVEDREALAAAVERIWTIDDIALVQRPVAGLDLRIDMLDGELLLAYLRRPLQLRGDGRSTAIELAQAIDPRLGEPGFRRKFSREPLWLRTLAEAGLGPEAVVPAGATIAFPAMILNLNRCCTAEVHAQLPAPWMQLARRVAAVMNLRHCGIDLRVPAAADPLAGDPAQAVILEVNASPSMGQIHKLGAAALVEEAERRVAVAILEGR